MDRQVIRRGGQLLAPSLFTLGNMACGFYALLSSVRGEFVSSAYAIIAGMVFDALDGRVARLVHGESSFGVEFDSMADFLTFGVAPGAHDVRLYPEGLRRLGLSDGVPVRAVRRPAPGALQRDGPRRRRLQDALHRPADPGGAGFLASFVLLYQIIEEGRPAAHWKFLMDEIPSALRPGAGDGRDHRAADGLDDPYPAFKQPGLIRPRSLPTLLILLGVGLLLFSYPLMVLFIVFLFYVLIGPVSWGARAVGTRLRLEARRARRGQLRRTLVTIKLSTGSSPSDVSTPRRSCPSALTPTTRASTSTRLEDSVVAPGEGKLLRSGVAVAVPAGHVGLVCDRSSLARRGLKTAGGVIDAGYRGEIGVVVWNLSREPQAVGKGRADRAAPHPSDRDPRSRRLRGSRRDGPGSRRLREHGEISA